MMTDPEITAAYDLIDQLVVKLVHDATYGPVYLQEKLLEARARQEDLANLEVRINRSMGSVLQEKVSQEAVARITTGDKRDQERALLVDIRINYERLKYLKEAVSVRKKNLQRVAQDVRLLLECLKAGLMAQGARPHVPVTAAETLPSVTAPGVDAATASKIQEFYGRPAEDTPAQPVSIDDIF